MYVHSAIPPAFKVCSNLPRSNGWTSCGSGPLFLATRNCSVREFTVTMVLLPFSFRCPRWSRVIKLWPSLISPLRLSLTSGCSLPVSSSASPVSSLCIACPLYLLLFSRPLPPRGGGKKQPAFVSHPA